MKRKTNIENLILKNYEPEFFSVIDVSEQHRGHQNFKEDVESHFEIKFSILIFLFNTISLNASF